MPDISSEKQTATTYPPTSLYNAWKAEADDLEIPVSQFIIRMVEAGRKQVNREDVARDPLHNLRQQRTNLQSELEHQRQRNQELERQLQNTVYSEVTSHVEQNPGVTTPKIIQHIADTVPGRVARVLDLLEGDALEMRDGEYYPQKSVEGEVDDDSD